MRVKNIDSQSESTLLLRALTFIADRQTSALKIYGGILRIVIDAPT